MTYFSWSSQRACFHFSSSWVSPGVPKDRSPTLTSSQPISAEGRTIGNWTLPASVMLSFSHGLTLSRPHNAPETPRRRDRLPVSQLLQCPSHLPLADARTQTGENLAARQPLIRIIQ